MSLSNLDIDFEYEIATRKLMKELCREYRVKYDYFDIAPDFKYAFKKAYIRGRQDQCFKDISIFEWLANYCLEVLKDGEGTGKVVQKKKRTIRDFLLGK